MIPGIKSEGNQEFFQVCLLKELYAGICGFVGSFLYLILFS